MVEAVGRGFMGVEEEDIERERGGRGVEDKRVGFWGVSGGGR